jgi:2-oxo-3-hexenedioate decarboxylase
MPIPLDLDALALEMKAAQDSAQQIAPFTTRMQGFDLAVAYEVAHRIHRARLKHGATPVGRKIGFTNPGMWSRFGVSEPIWAYIYDSTVRELQGTQATCPIGRYCEPKIEPEIVLHFRTAPPADARLVDVVNAIDWVAHGFEIVQSHFPGWRFKAPDTVADRALHGALLIGPRQPLSGLGSDPVAALESFSLNLSCNDRVVETGKGANVLGSPLVAAVHLSSVLAKQPGYAPLQAGEVVTTGTITMARSVHAGETWRSEVHGIGLAGLTVEFTA